MVGENEYIRKLLLIGMMILLLAFSFVNPLSTTAFAAETPVKVYIDGQLQEFDDPPFIERGVVLVPMRKIFEALNAKVIWEKTSRNVLVYRDYSFLRIAIGDQAAYRNGIKTLLDVPAKIVRNRTMVPLRFVSESIGYRVNWDPDTKSVIILTRGSIQSSSIESFPSTQINQLKESDGHKAVSNPNLIRLSSKKGDLTKGLMKFDISRLQNKTIKHAYLRMVNGIFIANATRIITVYGVKQPWTAAANWLSFDGIHTWEMPGANGSTDLDYSKPAGQTVFRIMSWEPSWLIEITPIVQDWMQNRNDGLAVIGDDYLSLVCNSAPPQAPQLVVEYQDSDSPNAELDYETKILTALSTLAMRYDMGPWSDYNSGIVNAKTNADLLNPGGLYRSSLETYFNHYLADDGSFMNGAKADNYYKAGYGIALIHLYQTTGKTKYKFALDALRRMYDEMRKADDIFINDYSIQNELSYLGLDFLAAYGEAFHDQPSLDLAMDQIIRLYDKCTATENDGIPIHIFIANGTKPKGKGWARGMGWLFGGMGKMLQYDGIKNHPRFAEFRDRYIQLASVLKSRQDDSGLWHNLIQNADTPLETSGTSLIALGFEYGTFYHVLGSEFNQVVERALGGLQTYSKTGTDMGQAFPVNEDLNYGITSFSSTTHAFGFWLELLTAWRIHRNEESDVVVK